MSTNNNDDNREADNARLTAYALGQLAGDELAAVNANLATAADDQARLDLRQIEALSAALTTARNTEPLPPTSSDLRKALVQRLAEPVSKEPDLATSKKAKPREAKRRLVIVGWSVAASLLGLALLLPGLLAIREAARRMQASNHLKQLSLSLQNYHNSFQPQHGRVDLALDVTPRIVVQEEQAQNLATGDPSSAPEGNLVFGGRFQRADFVVPGNVGDKQAQLPGITPADPLSARPPGTRGESASRRLGRADVEKLERAASANDGLARPKGDVQLLLEEKESFSRQQSADEAVDQSRRPQLDKQIADLSGKAAPMPGLEQRIATLGDLAGNGELVSESRSRRYALSDRRRLEQLGQTGEQYEPIVENSFLSPLRQPLSTFSIDVDTASYANVRRFLTSGRLPPPNSVRIEELVNYFRYEYPQSPEQTPFSVNMEVAECPWRDGHWLLKVGLKGKEVERTERPASNLVFLLDVSGSMADQNKLPLLKTAMKLLVNELGENDRVSIVSYAGDAGLRLAPTRGHEQQKITSVIDGLSAGGSTNGSAGINLAYKQAAAYFVPGGTNRVILCTDGDLNVGITSDDALVTLIKQKAAGGTFLTVLGFGEGNLKDAKMEKLADNGNGLYAYIDSVREARKVLVEQLTGSTITIAKDVKIQIEFNPAQIAAYRLLGYENRVMAAQDFNNDKKDAGEIGAGHTVTALYELVPVETAERIEPARAGVDPLKYQQPEADRGAPGPGLVPAKEEFSGELLTLKL